jgi:GLPGLI family protein
MNLKTNIMKKCLIAVTSLIGSFMFAQDFQGIAVYESKTTFDFSKAETKTDGDAMSPEMEAQLQEQLKKAMEKTYTLKFDKTASLYKEEEKLATPSSSGLTMTVSVSFNGGGTLYKNLKDKTALTETEIYGKEFLVTENLEPLEWKLENETKKIGNYTCYKATVVFKPRERDDKDKAIVLTSLPETDRTVTAWYTPEIPVSNGPQNYWGLPGLILEVNDGHTILLCSKITLNPKEKFTLKALKKGEKVSRREFDKIMEKKTEEMMEMNSAPSAPGTTRTTKVMRIGG